MSCEKECLGASDESIYERVRVRRLFVANSRQLVLARIKTPKNSYKIPERAVSCTLLMSGFYIFAADAAFQNRAARDFFTHPTKKNALSFPDYCQKAYSGSQQSNFNDRSLSLDQTNHTYSNVSQYVGSLSTGCAR